MSKHTSSKVNKLDTDFSLLLDQNIFWFDVRVHDSEVFEEGEGEEYLYSKGFDIEGVQRFEIISLQKLVQVVSQKFGDDTNVSAEDDEILDSQDIFAVLDIFLLYAHQDIDFVQSQMHLLASCPHNLDGDHLSNLVIVSFYHLTESPSAQPFQQLVPVSYLFVFSPQVSSFQVVFSCSSTNPHVVDCLLVDQFDALIFRQHLLIPLDNFLAGEAWEGFSELLAILKVALLDHAHLFLGPFGLLDCDFFSSVGLGIDFGVAATGFAGCADLAVRSVRIELFVFPMSSRFVVFSHGFWGLAEALGVCSGSAVEIVWHFWAIPGVGFVVMFVKFDFEVDLHIYNNCIIC